MLSCRTELHISIYWARKREQLLSDIHRALCPGGALILAEKIVQEHPNAGYSQRATLTSNAPMGTPNWRFLANVRRSKYSDP